MTVIATIIASLNNPTPVPVPDRYTHLVETLFAKWHRNLTLTLTLKAKIICAVKDDTETKLHTVLHLKVNFLGTGMGLRLITP